MDVGEFTSAQRHLDAARMSSDLGRDYMLEAHIYNRASMLAREQGRAAEAHALARRALEGTAARRHPKVRALFHARAAYGYAWQGRRSMVERSLSRAWASLDQAAKDGTPPWLGFVGRAEIHGQAAIAYNVLGRYAEAEQHAGDGLGSTAPGYARNRVHKVLHGVEALLGRREVEQAVEQATTAVRLAGGIRSGRVSRRLRAVRDQFATWTDVPDACAWVERFDAAKSA